MLVLIWNILWPCLSLDPLAGEKLARVVYVVNQRAESHPIPDHGPAGTLHKASRVTGHRSSVQIREPTRCLMRASQGCGPRQQEGRYGGPVLELGNSPSTRSSRFQVSVPAMLEASQRYSPASEVWTAAKWTEPWGPLPLRAIPSLNQLSCGSGLPSAAQFKSRASPASTFRTRGPGCT